MKALLLDLDHTLICPLENRVFPKDKDDWQFITGVPERVAGYLDKGYKIIIITNQGGIEAGFHTEADVREKLREVQECLAESCDMTQFVEDFQMMDFYYCTTNDKESAFRKPNPGMILLAAKEHDLELADCLFVGDMDTDQQAAQAAGVPFMWVKDFLAI